MGCTVQEVRQVRRSSATDHAVADCSNLVFCVLLATSANPQGGGGGGVTCFLRSTGNQCKSTRGWGGGRGVTCSRLEALQTKRAAQFNTH